MTNIDPDKRFLAVMEELLKFERSRQSLGPCVYQFQEVSPRLVDAIFPLRDQRGIGVTGLDQLVADLVHCGHSLLADHLRLAGKLSKPFAEHLTTRN